MIEHEKIFLKNIGKSYGATQVFKDFSAAFDLGTVHCIMGESGRGKTTILRIIMGLEKPDNGQIIGMEGKSVAAVFQEDRLCENLTVSANIRMVNSNKTLTPKEIAIYLRDIGMEGTCGKQVSELSGGMKRRVAILRAVLADRDVIFFDEPLKGLDDDTEKKLMDTIVPLLSGKTVFWVTHREKEAEYFNSENVKLWRY